jgi:hypothetical protein
MNSVPSYGHKVGLQRKIEQTRLHDYNKKEKSMRKMFVGNLLCMILLGPLPQGFSFGEQDSLPTSEYRIVPAVKGECCIVCGVALSKEDIALIVRGRRVPLSKGMVRVFLENPEKYFSRMQPKGALFQEDLSAPAGAAQAGITWGWFLLGLYILTALLCGGFSGYSAISKGLSAIPFFFLGFFLSVFGLIYTLTRPKLSVSGEVPSGLVKVPATATPMACQACGNTNHPAARRCARCGGTLDPRLESEVSRV